MSARLCDACPVYRPSERVALRMDAKRAGVQREAWHLRALALCTRLKREGECGREAR